MKFTDKALERIEAAKWEWVKERSPRKGEGISIRNDVFGEAGVYRNERFLFSVEEMWSVINELNAMVDIVKDEVGVYEEV